MPQQPNQHHLNQLVDRVARDSLREDALSADSVLKSWLREMIEAATQALLRNDGLRGRLNNWMHEVVVEVVQSHQHDVGVLIADTVRGWDTETVTARVERQVGEDLQYIRINGTLIGGLVLPTVMEDVLEQPFAPVTVTV